MSSDLLTAGVSGWVLGALSVWFYFYWKGLKDE